MRQSARIKRSDCLAFFWSDNELHAINYLTGVRLLVPSTLVGVLNNLATWHTSAAVVRMFPHSAPAAAGRLLRFLEASTFIVREGSTQAARERTLAPWRAWSEEARLFHFATKRTHHAPPETDEPALVRSLLKRGPVPSPTKSYRGLPQIVLPPNDPRMTRDFPQILLRRRTRRQFGASKVSLGDMALLLKLTWGFTGSRPWPGLGRVPLKTSPSGGARHPIEVYLVPLKVAGLKRSVHYYDPMRHTLIDLQTRVTPADVQRFCGHQSWTRDAAALFIMTAVIPRVTWRYRSSRAYRVMLLEAGHFCQTLCLLATWLNLAPFSTAALDDEYIEKRLGIDGASETVVYAAGIGAPPDASFEPGDPTAPSATTRSTRP